ncbi:hypothetical protein [Bradyrhizobium sp. CCBAU 51765]|uniref:hypothetical protein n=1 Tax=Bradyrhizobium sp. CCBAU 51765 TaxID=1325102 RepID=UPI001AEE8E46|nr:hypothetical protein [Bradyrhizobium sp. CCBAU 51765]
MFEYETPLPETEAAFLFVRVARASTTSLRRGRVDLGNAIDRHSALLFDRAWMIVRFELDAGANAVTQMKPVSRFSVRG